MARPKDPGRRDVLEARLVDHVLANGVANLSLREVAEALGISTYPLTYHFGSKDGLVAAALAGVEERQLAMLTEWAASDPGGGFGDLIRRFWAWYAREDELPYSRLYLEVHALALGDPARFPGFLERGGWSSWIGFVERLAVQRGVPEAEAGDAAALALSVATGALLGLLATGDRAVADRSVEFVARAFDRR